MVFFALLYIFLFIFILHSVLFFCLLLFSLFPTLFFSFSKYAFPQLLFDSPCHSLLSTSIQFCFLFSLEMFFSSYFLQFSPHHLTFFLCLLFSFTFTLYSPSPPSLLDGIVHLNYYVSHRTTARVWTFGQWVAYLLSF